jgi:hypothetical protein
MSILTYLDKYNRVSMVTDSISELNSDIFFEYVKNNMINKCEILNKFKFDVVEEREFHCLDELNDISDYDVVPFRMLKDNFIKRVKPIDLFLFRGHYYNSIDMRGVDRQYVKPLKITYESEIILVIKDNKLIISKDRYGFYGNRNVEMDIKSLILGCKIEMLKNRING